ncbi:MAG: folylpolyglutamate synthase/dihydrofolate synthase family protein [archaeon]
MNSEEATNYLQDLQKHGIHLGLDIIEEILNALGNPQNDYKTVHIAGTNGKGSVVAMVSEALKLSGFKTAIYTSPHLISIQERFLINGELISQERFSELVGQVREVVESLGIKPTFFEFVTASAFKYFSDEKVDYAVFETGMGGRLDATNMITPEISVITNIDLEHTKHLGDTVEKIAEEKAGIIKRRVPVVTGAMHGALEFIRRKAVDMEAPLHIIHKPYTGEVGLNGEFQKVNAAIAAEALRVLGLKPDIISKAIKTAKWPGRMQFEGNILLDGSHNPAGFKVLIDELKKLDKRFIFVTGLSEGKDYAAIFKLINPIANKIILTKTKVSRAVDPSEYSEHAKDPIITRNVPVALKKAQGLAKEGDLIVVTGVFTVGEAMEYLGITPSF